MNAFRHPCLLLSVLLSRSTCLCAQPKYTWAFNEVCWNASVLHIVCSIILSSSTAQSAMSASLLSILKLLLHTPFLLPSIAATRFTPGTQRFLLWGLLWPAWSPAPAHVAMTAFRRLLVTLCLTMLPPSLPKMTWIACMACMQTMRRLSSPCLQLSILTTIACELSTFTFFKMQLLWRACSLRLRTCRLMFATFEVFVHPHPL